MMKRNNVPIASDNTQTIDDVTKSFAGSNVYDSEVNVNYVTGNYNTSIAGNHNIVINIFIGHSTTGNESAITGNIEIHSLDDLKNLIQPIEIEKLLQKGGII